VETVSDTNLLESAFGDVISGLDSESDQTAQYSMSDKSTAMSPPYTEGCLPSHPQTHSNYHSQKEGPKANNFLSEFAKFVQRMEQQKLQESAMEDESCEERTEETVPPEPVKKKRGRKKKIKTSSQVKAELWKGTSLSDAMLPSQCGDGEGDAKYALRPKRKMSYEQMLELDIEESTAPSMAQTPAKRAKYADNTAELKRWQHFSLQLVRLRHKICRLFKVLFPRLVYPVRFSRDTHVVEELMDQVMSAATDSDFEEKAVSACMCPREMKLVLCKDPKLCLQHVRRKVCHLLKVLLPDLKFESNFDKTGKAVDQLLRKVIDSNKVS